MAPAITIEKHWDGNVCETESNGRIYVSRGRWQWVVIVDGEADRAFDRKREAVARVEQLKKERGQVMAKRKAEDLPVLDMVPADAEVVETKSDGHAIAGWLHGLVPFFAKAGELERAAVATLQTAKALKLPESSGGDEVIQKFILKTNADRKALRAHWEITSIVHRFHRRLTAKRDVGEKALEEANTIGNRLHNEYVRVEQQRVLLEERKAREAAEFQARELQRQELERLEAEAVEAEAAAPGLSEREARFVELYMSRPIDAVRHAATAGYKNPREMAERLLASPKILAAIDAKRQAEAIRKQAEARARMPVEVEDVPEVKADITRAGSASERTTVSVEIVNDREFVLAALSGQFGIPALALAASQPGLNQCARDMGELVNRWPGVRFKRNTKVI